MVVCRTEHLRHKNTTFSQEFNSQTKGMKNQRVLSITDKFQNNLIKGILIPTSSNIRSTIMQNNISLQLHFTINAYTLSSQFCLNHISTLLSGDILLECLDIMNWLHRHQINSNNGAFHRHLLCSHLGPFKSTINRFIVPSSWSCTQINQYMGF